MAKLEIEITQEQVEMLRERAADNGLSLERWALQTLLEGRPSGSLAEAVAPYVVYNDQSSAPKTPPLTTDSEFEDYLVQKKHEGHF